MWHGQTAHNKR